MINITKPTQIMSDDAAKVMKNTYGLVALGLLFSVLTGAISHAIGLTALFANPIGLIAFFVIQIGLIFVIHKKANEASGLIWIFLFTGIEGMMLDPYISQAFAINGGAVMNALLTTAAIVGAMAYVGATTKKDLSFLGKILFASLIGLLVAMILSMFFPSSIFQFCISVFASILFSVFIMYDTNEIATGRETSYIRAALGMYLNIINLFIHLVSLCGGNRD